MPCLRPSSEVDLVKPKIACFETVYAVESGRGVHAEIEPLLMILPPWGDWSFMILIASRVHFGQRSFGVKHTSTAPMMFMSLRGQLCCQGAYSVLRNLSMSCSSNGLPFVRLTPAFCYQHCLLA